ncbi:iron-sulfur cluster assembly accessory protein Isa2 [Coprinopsis cinerea AmutBmut pab1-1]|nr:iron-sulfur cluster assembly accessory protein Isa2 [Coprinopsis cinerea AmutBmut pab1-1]
MSSSRVFQSLRSLARLPHRHHISSIPNRTRQPLQQLTTTRPNVKSFSASASCRAAVATQVPSQPTVLQQTPSLQYLEEEEIDVEPIPPEQVKLVITDRAAEQLKSIANREKDPEAALRIAVESGGCHGYQYKMELAKSRAPDDYHFTHPTIKPANIFVDAVSLTLLNGSTIDFATELIGSSFRVDDNPQAKGAGCGCGVSWELKDS